MAEESTGKKRGRGRPRKSEEEKLEEEKLEEEERNRKPRHIPKDSPELNMWWLPKYRNK